ncbi:hypothetical protein A3762_05535 [Oleiphilus sp. HI0125]|uniref:MotA/TolQ/ExbB proton channel family protein n=1 Tax=Oleiphilus sp. HI0125 TaxID=1822266 RepID=UPI0007C3E04C|nr:MotA/TolQ/ExbB proton channel family protein [Oleiphilus sp. HI0125]KZZ59310.1 hypothetical protein A3762_05535 [Oleiphilus sp. HI0125]
MDFTMLFMQALRWSFIQPISSLFEQGGPVLWLISIVAMIMIVLAAERLWFLTLSYKSERDQITSRWQARQDKGSLIAHRVRQAMLARFKHQLRLHLWILRGLVMICPLLGLLGTVTGMISVFDVMAYSGTGNARSMAAGISKATIPTMAGMTVAIVGLLLIARIDQLARSRHEALTAQLSVS